MNDKLDFMEAPCICQHCDQWFDLDDGVGSEKWYPKNVICEKCREIEEKEIEKDEEIEDLETQISDAIFTLIHQGKELAELKGEEYNPALIRLRDTDDIKGGDLMYSHDLKEFVELAGSHSYDKCGSLIVLRELKP